MTIKIQIPEKFSTFLKMAITESESLDRRLFSPSANVWHSYREDLDQCLMCFAGAWVAGMYMRNDYKDLRRKFEGNSLKQMSTCFTPDQNDMDTLTTILNYVRCGDLLEAAEYFYGDPINECGKIEELNEIKQSIRNEDFTGWKEYDRFIDSIKQVSEKLDAMGL